MLLIDFATRLKEHHPQLAGRLTLTDVVHFVTLASDVYQRAHKAINFTSNDPKLLPFLQLSLKLGIETSDYQVLWNLTFPSIPFTHLDSNALIRQHGLDPALDDDKVYEVYFTPPNTTCIKCDQVSGNSLVKRPRVDGYAYDLDGVHSAEFHTWGCLDCKTYYRPSYYTSNRKRYYYTAAEGAHPTWLQVHCHSGVSYRLAKAFRQSQMLAHTSHFNLVNLFNLTFLKDQTVPTHTGAQSFSPRISQEFARDAADLWSLLRRCSRRGAVLQVSARGHQTDRLLPAMARELHYSANYGSPYRNHFCSRCVKKHKVQHEGKDRTMIIRAVVTDGLTIGHWRCTASSAQLEELAHRAGAPRPNGPCLNPLPKVTSRFCSEHEQSLKGWCIAQPCTAPAEVQSTTCSNPAHIKAAAAFESNKKKNFSLKSMLNRPGSKLPCDPSIHLDPNTAELIDLDHIQQADEADRAHEAARDGGDGNPKGTPSLSRCRTHNDQLIVGTCGIVLARATFYNAEAPSAVRNYLIEAFPEQMPEVIFYDNACTLLRVIHNGDVDPTPFENTVIPVDPFHHHSHKQSDLFCQRYTDPKKFPDLQRDGSWVFNASAGELSNIWYGGFASMCRNMEATRYEFFLEEMVEGRNEWLSDALASCPDVEYIGIGKL